MRFVKHVPSFVDYREEIVPFEFEVVKELLEIPEMKNHSQNPSFSHFALSEHGKNYCAIMAIFDDGFKWWVVGFTDAENIFPKWNGWKFRALLEGTECVLDKDVVVSSCGDVLTLVDGRQAKNLRY